MDDKTTSTTFDDSYSTITSMASSSNKSIVSPTYKMNSHDKMDIKHTLMSPPESTPLDNFNSATPTKTCERFPLSPPVSPAVKTILTVEEGGVRDPILFERTTPTAQPPLFDDSENRRLVESHIRARPTATFRAASPPRTSEYELVLEFKSQVAQRYNTNRKMWRAREVAQLRQDDALRTIRRYPVIAPASRAARIPKPAGVTKRVKVVKPVVRSDTPDRRVAREDKEFGLLPDYCPPLSSLPSKPNSLKVDWKGAPIDLRHDVHASLLHPDELLLAGNLRLDCATYLTSKRRIFIKRRECLQIGKEFRKTDAQQACKIDVNKASKLWAVFEKVGWLDAKWMK